MCRCGRVPYRLVRFQCSNVSEGTGESMWKQWTHLNVAVLFSVLFCGAEEGSTRPPWAGLGDGTI